MMRFSPKVFLCCVAVWVQLAPVQADYRELGYLYLFPRPGAEFVSRNTKSILVRLKEIAPGDLKNLPSFITVTGSISGRHLGYAKIAGDQRTVIFEIEKEFQSAEVVTVALDPVAPSAQSGAISPYRYKFATSGPMPPSSIITARGEFSASGTKENAFDEDTATAWADLLAPEGGTNSTWIQLVYPRNETRVINEYVITASADPAEAPASWQLYGVDGTTNLVFLDSQQDRRFAAPGASITCTTGNHLGFRGYRLLITAIAGPATAERVEIAEIQLRERQGSILREYWTGIPGKWVSDLTNNSRFPTSPNGSELIPCFEGPTGWSDNYGARFRAFLTAPVTGDFLFWVAADESSELWLGTNEFPNSKRRIAVVRDWTEPRQWFKYFGQRSEPIHLVAGQRYYVEALHKEADGADNFVVAWSKPGEDTLLPSEIIPGSVLSALSESAQKVDLGSAMPEPVNAEQGETRRSTSLLTATPKLLSLTAKTTPGTQKTKNAKILPNGVSIPSDFPQLEISLSDNPSPGYIFLENDAPSGARFTLMLDNSGTPVWYRRGEGRDFKVQRNGTISWGAAFTGRCTPFTGLDSNFVWRQTYSAVNGFGTDEHELKVLPNGGYLLIGALGEMADLRPYVRGGLYNVFVYQTVVQEFTAAGELIFQFSPWDHFNIQDVDPVVEDPRNSGVRFPHINAIDVDDDGHLVISSRHLNEVTKINRDTGEIIWRLGGAHSDFAFVNDTLNGFKAQHDVTALGNGRYLLFDNGNGHSPPVSRAVEYSLSLQEKTATLTWEFRDSPSRFTHFMGSAQRLTNGNTLINFALGEYPKVTEVDRAGVKRFVMNLSPHTDLYRAFRFPWNGVTPLPYLLLEPQADNVTLIFNKFGDTNVDHYCIYGGVSPEPTNLIAISRATLKHLTNVVSGTRNYFRVTAVGKNGVESDFSNEESLMVQIVRPEENLIANSAFSDGTNGWALAVAGPAAAAWNVDAGVAALAVSHGGSSSSDIQLRQTGVSLIQSKTYDLEFDAWTDQPRYLEARLASVAVPPVYYSGATPFYLTPLPKHFHESFTMVQASDPNAVLLFNAGGSAGSVYLDNISLVFHDPKPGDLNRDGVVDFFDLKLLSNDWMRKGEFPADGNQDGMVNFEDFGMLGANWRKLVQ